MKIEDFKQIASHIRPPITQEHYAQLHDSLRQMGLDPNNLYQELEMSHRFVQVHWDTSYSNAILSLHSHSFYEILCCRNTCGAEYLVGADRYRLKKGDIIVLSPGVSHRPLLPEAMQEPYSRDVLWVSGEFMELIRRQLSFSLDLQSSQSCLLRTAGTRWEYLAGLLHAAVKESEQALPDSSIVVLGSVLCFLAHLKRAFEDKSLVSPAAEKPDLLVQAIAYIEGHLGQRVSLDEIAHHFYVSKSTISQLFRKKMGVSFYRCVTQRRLITAKQLIGEKLALEAVAEQTGFSDYSAFYRAFKQEYGISPRQYRAMQSESPTEGI